MIKKLHVVVTRKYGLLTSDLFVKGLADPHNYKKLFFIDFFVGSGVIFDKWCFGPQIQELGERLLAQEEKEAGFVNKVFTNIYGFGEKLLEYSERIKTTDFLAMSDKKLFQIFNDFTKQYKTLTAALAGWGLQLPVEAQLREVLKDRQNLDEDLAVLCAPEKQNIINLEQEALTKIGALIQTSGAPFNAFEELSKDLKEKIVKHAEKFGWMTRGGLDDPWKPQEVFERLRSMMNEDCGRKLSEMAEHKKKAREMSVTLLDKMNADDNLRRLVKIAKELVYYRTYRTDYLNLIMFNARPLVAEIGRRMGNLNFKEVSYLREQEIIDRRQADKEEISRRIKNFLIFSVEPNEVIFSSDPNEMKKLEEKYLEHENIDLKIIKGSVAFPGKVVGKVFVVLSKKDLPKIGKGDIIVSTMTTPDYIVAMEKAAAFVTDEGGITCHAAIIAREMKKPCITGTKVATKILKDGDMVEVDAEKGIVRIIKH